MIVITCMLLGSWNGTVEGVAQVVGGDVAKARDEAIRNAQKNAVAEALGVYVKSEFSAAERESMKNGLRDAESRIEDKLRTSSEGVIERQKVVAEKRDGDVYRVSLLAVVTSASLADAVAGLKSAAAAVGMPTLLVIGIEEHTGKDGQTKKAAQARVSAELERALLSAGLRLENAAKASGLATRAEALFAELDKGAKPSLPEAGQTAAEVVVLVRAATRITGFNELNDNMYYAAGEYALRAIRVSDGALLASAQAAKKGVGVDEQSAVKKATDRAAPELVEQLQKSLTAAWKQEAETGRSFVLVVDKVKNYKTQGRPLLKALEGFKQAQVRELSYASGKLQIEVTTKGSKKELLDYVLDTIAAKAPFRSLDKTSESGDKIELSL